ncbi:MAG TPA: PilZ domain-containing protein [Terriglobales bacterium]|jgi:hypothetical protein|nr:PilZ domain-containing protein [Terriglobales bacterium]
MTTAAKTAGPGDTAGTVHEARTGQRFPLQLPITISEGQSPRKHLGTTANVSAAGVYVRAEKPLKVGSKIVFDIMLPGKVLGVQRDVKIRCTGRVVRAESSRRFPRTKRATARENLRGMACVIDQYRFVRK